MKKWGKWKIEEGRNRKEHKIWKMEDEQKSSTDKTRLLSCDGCVDFYGTNLNGWPMRRYLMKKLGIEMCSEIMHLYARDVVHCSMYYPLQLFLCFKHVGIWPC